MGTRSYLFCDRCGTADKDRDIVMVQVTCATQYSAKAPWQYSGDFCANCRDNLSAVLVEATASKT